MAFLDKQLVGSKRFEFVSDSFSADKFAVVNMVGYEAISKPFRFTLTLVSDDANVDMRKMLKDSSTLRIYSVDGKTTAPYHGVLAEFEQLHQSGGYVFYRAVLVPRLWRLSLNRTSEVYLNEQTIPDILETVLKDGQLVTSDFEQKLSGSYRHRSFVCQYQESHLDFLSRWMEKEGMYYFFDHDGAADKLMLVDDKNMHDPSAISVSYRPEGELDTGASLDAVQGFVCRRKALPRQVVLQDYNYRKADLELKVSHAVSDDGYGEVMLYGENFRNELEGHRYAKLRAEEFICNGEVFSGEATAVGLRSGRFMALSHHYRATTNGCYLVTEVHHEGSQAGALLEGFKNPYGGSDGETSYRNTFMAIPAEVQFRAQRRTAKPQIAGTMSATIDAEGSGQYAELDEYGQYKVQFPFDRSDKAASKGSARVRMASPYAGQDHGMHFPLHKNTEVVLSFAGGDPDEPIIVGAVPNSENRSLVGNQNASQNLIHTSAGNRLEMDDKEGGERVHLSTPHSSTLMRMGAPSPKPVYRSLSSAAVTLGELEAIANDASFQMQTDGSMFTSGGHDWKIVNGDRYNYTHGNTFSTTDGNNDSVVKGDTTKIVHGKTTTTSYGDVTTTVEGNVVQMNKKSISSVCMGANNSVFLGERSMTTAGVFVTTNTGGNFTMNTGVNMVINNISNTVMNNGTNTVINDGLNAVMNNGVTLENQILKIVTTGVNFQTGTLNSIAVALHSIV